MCGAREDMEHVFKCHDGRARRARHHGFRKLKTWLQEIDFPEPEVFSEILRGLTPSTNEVTLERAIPEQLEIGRATSFGILSTSWRRVFEKMDDSPRKLNSKRWRTELCKKLMQVSWDMWDFRNSVRHSSSSVHYQRELERLRGNCQKEQRDCSQLTSTGC